MNDPVTILKQDHREAEAMLKTLAESSPGARRRSTVEKLTKALTLHMEIEENDLYPLVRERLGAEPAEEAEIEHGLARDGLQQLQSLVDEPGFGAVVAMLTAGIKHHVKEEEKEILPELKRQLDRSELQQLGDEIAAAKKRRPARRVA